MNQSRGYCLTGPPRRIEREPGRIELAGQICAALIGGDEMGRLQVSEHTGGPASRGDEHGRALAKEIHILYDLLIAQAAAGVPPIDERDVLAYALSHLPESRAFAPDLVEEVEAIAMGADLPFEKVWLEATLHPADA